MNPDPSILTIVLNWNNPEDTLACLRSVTAINYPAMQTIVVDNGSTDDSVARVRAAHPGIKVIETGENLGYAGGNNVGIRYGLNQRFDLFCILNNDVTVASDFLIPLLAVLMQRIDVGVVTPLLVSPTEPPRILNAGVTFDFRTGQATHRFQGQAPDTPGVNITDVDVASGSAMLVRRQMFEKFGFLPEKYFLYYEDAHWCTSVWRGGYRVVCQPRAHARHRISATLGRESQLITYYMTRNQLLFLWLNAPENLRYRVLLRILGQDIVYIASDGGRRHWGRARARLLGIVDFVTGRFGPCSWSVEGA